MEGTGHYRRNLFAYLVSEGFTVALLNPIRTRRFAEDELGAPRPMRLMPSISLVSRGRKILLSDS